MTRARTPMTLGELASWVEKRLNEYGRLAPVLLVDMNTKPSESRAFVLYGSDGAGPGRSVVLVMDEAAASEGREAS